MTTETTPDHAGRRPDARPTSPGLRERQKSDKLRRIVAAATELFAEHGYTQVTTHQIAEVAEVGTGTLFRYAGSKAELLMMVMNERLRLGTEQGVELARQGASPTDAIAAMLAPLASESLAYPENTIVYQRETLFGSGPHRELAAERVDELQDAIHTVLRLDAERHGRPAAPDLADVAHVIFATVYLDVVRVSAARASIADLPERIRRSISFLVDRMVTTPRTEDLDDRPQQRR